MRTEALTPPADESHTWRPATCLDCEAVKTWHRRSRCNNCARWATTIDAHSVTAGDVTWQGPTWGTVTRVRHDNGWVHLEVDGVWLLPKHPLAEVVVLSDTRVDA